MSIYYVLLLLCGFSLCLVLDVARALAVCVCVGKSPGEMISAGESGGGGAV